MIPAGLSDHILLPSQAFAAGSVVKGAGGYPSQGLLELAAGPIVEGAGGYPSQGLVELAAWPVVLHRNIPPMILLRLTVYAGNASSLGSFH